MEELLIGLLASVAGGQRYWVRAPQKVKQPYIVMQKAGGTPDYHMTGPSGLVSSRVQIDVYGETFTLVTSISRQIKTILSGYTGGAIQAIFVDSERSLPAADAGEVNTLVRNSIDIIIHHGEIS